MTKKEKIEYYVEHKAHLIETMTEFANSGQISSAWQIYGALWELINIAYNVEKIISEEQYYADDKQVAKLFYDSVEVYGSVE